jgi:glutathione S-transferase
MSGSNVLPVLYSFRRCPYAIRARMAILYSGLSVELREVFLADKPPSMMEASPKGTVPILLLPDDRVVEESYEVMRWALNYHDPNSWWRAELADETKSLVEENDDEFKAHLDHYKYSDRFPEQPKSHYRDQGERFLNKLELLLRHKQYLQADELTFSDVAIFPFVRQFAFVDKSWFDQSPYPYLQEWLQSFLDSQLFLSVMDKLPAWANGDKPVLFPASSRTGEVLCHRFLT